MKTPQPAKQSVLKALAALVAAVAIIICLFRYTPPPSPPETSGNESDRSMTDADKAVFFDRSVAPLLDTNSSANARALDHLMAEIHTQFEQYRNRVPNFTADITGGGNKIKIAMEALKQMTSDDKKKVERHVTAKFEMHVVSAEKMQSDLETILQGFRRDIEANRNRMLADIEAAVSADPRLSAAGVRIPDSFTREIEDKISEASGRTGKNLVVLSSWTLVVSFATEDAVRRLVTCALTQVGESLAVSMGITAATSGGATVTGGVGGGTAGTLLEPGLGTAVGAGAGLVVGLAVDWVMSKRMEAKLTDECRDFLTNSELALTRDPSGLIASLHKVLAEVDEVRGPLIKQQIGALP